MTLLTSEEAKEVTDAFVHGLYGDDLFSRWKDMKQGMNFMLERDFVTWLLDIAELYNANSSDLSWTKDAAGDSMDTGSEGHSEAAADMKTDSCYSQLSQFQSPPLQALDHCEVGPMEGSSDYADHKPQDIGYSGVKELAEGHQSVDPSKALVLPNADVDDTENLLTVNGKFFCCTYCTYQTTLKGNMTRHIRRIHVKQKRYSCPHCNFSSFENCTVNRHIDAVHRKVKPYTCHYCDKSFTQKIHMVKHVSRKHMRHMDGSEIMPGPAMALTLDTGREGMAMPLV